MPTKTHEVPDRKPLLVWVMLDTLPEKLQKVALDEDLVDSDNMVAVPLWKSHSRQIDRVYDPATLIAYSYIEEVEE